VARLSAAAATPTTTAAAITAALTFHTLEVSHGAIPCAPSAGTIRAGGL
jgi:hypothetical protein